jgi:serine phosphatase RsbU (regulator of sigma subunit)
MELMLRRHLTITLGFWMLLIGALSFAVIYAGEMIGLNFYEYSLAGIGSYFLLSLFLLWIKVSHPITKITKEMRALLTGKTYKRISSKQRGEVGLMAHFFNEVTRSLESISTDVQSRERIRKELNAAQEIQRNLLPKQNPKFPELEVTAKTRSASELGGDTFDFFTHQGRYLLFIGDSTGHGVPAGIVMIMVDTLLESFISLFPKMTDVMINVNKYLKPHLQTTMFMTLIFGEWLPANKSFQWVGAGHEYIVHVQTKLGTVSSIPSGGIALGMLDDNTAQVKQQSITLHEDDFIVLFSDGIIEAKNVMGEIYTLNRLEKMLKNQASTNMSTKDLFQKIANDVGQFMEGNQQDDDMTLIVMKHTTKVTSSEDSTDWS